MPTYLRGSDNFDSANLLGVGQTWQNVTGSRALGTTYTNSTSKPIMVMVAGAGGAAGLSYANATVAGTTFQVAHCGNASFATYGSGSFIVPAGATYSVVSGAASWALQVWNELR